jgi:hypothetical protein
MEMSKGAPVGRFVPPMPRNIQNPYRNPMPFCGNPPVAQVYRDLNPNDTLRVNDAERALWMGTGETDPGLMFNQIPDPTLTARFPVAVPTPKSSGDWIGPIFDGAYLYRS